MQRCPKCYRTFENDNQKYCTACGGRLMPNEEITTAYGLGEKTAPPAAAPPGPPSPPAAFDPNLTMPSKPLPPSFDPNKTVLNTPSPSFDPNKTVLNTPPPPPPGQETVAIHLTATDKTSEEDELAFAETDDIVAPTVALNRAAAAEETPPPPAPEPFEVVAPPVEVALPPPLEPDLPTPAPLPPPVFASEPPAPPLAEETPAPVSEPVAEVVAAPPPAPVPPPAVAAEAAAPTAPAPPPKAKSRAPLILAILGLLGLLGAGGLAAGYFFFAKPYLEARNAKPAPTPAAKESPVAPTPAPEKTSAVPKAPLPDVPPPDSKQFVNQKAGLSGNLAEHYADFSFYHPKAWKVSPPNQSNFISVSNVGPDGVPLEDFSVSYYNSKGTFAADQGDFAAFVAQKSDELAKFYQGYGYKVLGEGPTKVNSAEAYELRYEAQLPRAGGQSLPLWGRVIFVPPGVKGEKNGVTIFLTATGQAKDVKGIDDVGVKGGLPVMLESFRLGKR
jgi:hypothetical protein